MIRSGFNEEAVTLGGDPADLLQIPFGRRPLFFQVTLSLDRSQQTLIRLVIFLNLDSITKKIAVGL